MPSLIESLAQAWWSWMAAMFWQVSLLIAIVGLADLALRRWAWPQVRIALWTLVLIKLVLPPTWTSPMGLVAAVRHAVERPPAVAAATAPDTALAPPGAAEPGAPTGSLATAGEIPAAEATPALAVLAMAVWLSGVIALGALLAIRIAALRRWHRLQDERGTIPPWFHELLVATATRLGLDRLPAIVFSDQAVAPAVYGVFRPTLLLPAAYLEALDRGAAEHVLLHELAHIKRGDLVVNALWLTVQAIYWFNPLVAWARREVKHVREMCCDLTVASVLRDGTPGYRATLLETARGLLTEAVEPGMGLLGVFEEPFRLLPRLRMLERPTWRHRKAAAVVSVASFALLAPVLLPMAAARPAASAGPQVAAPTMASAPSSDADGGDLFLLENVHADDLVLGVPVITRVMAVNTTWIGDGVIAVTERNATTVLDRRRGRLVIASHRDRTYVEAPLDADPATLLSADALKRVAGERTGGTVTPLSEGARYLGRACRGFEVTIWRVWGDDAGQAIPARVWTTTEIDADLGLYDAYLALLRRLQNRDDALRRALEAMPGVQVRFEQSLGRRGPFSRRVIAEVTEIVRRPAPAGTYDPPAGYTRVERLASFGR